MNDPKFHLDDVIDRIVDGGLSRQELRAAVARLDASPDHWRRCALAFIEAQALGEILRDADERRVPIGDVIPFRRRAIAARRLAYAASLAVVAFSLGWLGHGAAGLDTGLGVGLGTGTVPVSTTRSIHRPEASGVERGTVPSARVLGAGLPTPPEPTTEVLHAGEQIEIPFEDWVRAQPPAISSYEQALLEREGYEVQQHREVLFGSFEDGRLAAVPVDEVELKYVGHMPL